MGGVAYSHRSSTIAFKNCTFTDNYASKGGVSYLSDEGSANFSDCLFSNNDAVEGDMIYMIQSYETSFIINCTFERDTVNYDE